MGIDIGVIVVYLVLINAIGILFSRKQSITDYFLGGRSISWGFAALSIVATETSTLTFVSIPGLAYVKGMGFLQVALGYLLGRILVAWLLIPAYFKGELNTVYAYLQNRFGAMPRKVVAVLFHLTRMLSDSVRLFATAIPLAVLAGWDYRLAVLVIGVATLIYTYYGGLKSVIIVDSIQLIVYLACAFIGMAVVRNILMIPFSDIFNRMPSGVLAVFSSGVGELATSYNVFSGILGGAFLSFASHGTDHLIVQRVLACKTVRHARMAMVSSGVLIIFQFALFMVWGLFLGVLFNQMPFERSDAIIPHFIAGYVPAGLKGLMLAGILAAAMSTLSSSINALSSSTVLDILEVTRKKWPESQKVRLSRLITLFWAFMMIGISVLLHDTRSPLVEVGLSIASVTYGGILGIFIIGRFSSSFRAYAVVAGVFAGIVANILVILLTPVFWLWYTMIGCAVSWIVSGAVNRILFYREKAGRIKSENNVQKKKPCR